MGDYAVRKDIMKDYIATIETDYHNVFYVSANNMKEALNKVYEHCTEMGYDTSKKDITIKLLSELYKESNVSGVLELSLY